MRRLAVAGALLGALGVFAPAPPAAAQVSVSVNFTIGTFYDELSPYGQWIECGYGECWVPRGIGPGWQPYSNGEWIYTRYGWTWVSHDPWGGDPYHYGTWTVVNRYGWVWVPGTVWAPAWVTWSYSDRYVGWAPLPPATPFGRTGYSGSAVVVSHSQYVFVPTDRFVGTNVMSVRLEPRQNEQIFRQATPMTRFAVAGGIVTNEALPLATIQRATGTRIETREISTARTTPRPVSSGASSKSGKVAIVAPASEVKAAHASRRKAAPSEAQQQDKPRQQAEPKQEKHPQQQAQPRQQEQPQQQAQPRQQEQPQQQAKPKKEQPQQAPKSDSKEKGKSEEKDKKDPKGGGGRTD